MTDMQLSDVLRGGANSRTWWCEGCEEPHGVTAQINGQGPGWGFNGDDAAPTLSPSILVTSGHFAPGFDPAKQRCWCTYNAEQVAKGEEPAEFVCYRCHTFVVGGVVDFLADCTHKFAGQKRPLPSLPDHMRDPV